MKSNCHSPIYHHSEPLSWPFIRAFLYTANLRRATALIVFPTLTVFPTMSVGRPITVDFLPIAANK